ncbi:PREDICTED: putative F-box protein At3g13624 [Brassica oleracea var. oleracea]|uniref:putative F-box protein At3g13624 n=1 Tax=Brassica oleracea var. oleracea TaxID=109376 RepID=UPI0006A6F8A4|nr:PREDICTED: putative F-box protein At3g13624 [Brassica oleracea var. oleracea]
MDAPMQDFSDPFGSGYYQFKGWVIYIEEGGTHYLVWDATRPSSNLKEPERFGKRLPLPFKTHDVGNFVSLSCVREEQLAVLHQSSVIDHTLEIWVSSNIDLGAVSWSKFLRTTSFCRVDFQAGSFFIDEEKKVAVVIDLDDGGQARTETRYNQRANIIGEDEYFKSVNVGEALNHGKRNKFGFVLPVFSCPLVCPYVPSSAQLQMQYGKCIEGDD